MAALSVGVAAVLVVPLGMATGSAEAAPPGRAYEMVSPVDKASMDATSVARAKVTPSGDRVAFVVHTGSYPGSASTAMYVYYRAERRDGRWVTTHVDAPQLNEDNTLIATTYAASADLSKFFQASRYALAPGAVDGGSNIYVRDIDSPASTSLVAGGSSSLWWNRWTGASVLQPSLKVHGATEDLQHIVFSNTEQLTPEAIDNGEAQVYSPRNLYEWSPAGGVRLAGVLPDGSTPPSGVGHWVPSGNGLRAVSGDGDRILFTDTNTSSGPLYMREDGVTTALSDSRRSGDPGDPRPVEAGGLNYGISVDGSTAFFLSQDPLTDESDTGSLDKLYRLDVDTDTLIDLTATGSLASAGQARQVLGVSESGDRVYFLVARAGAGHIYEWHDGTTRLVAGGLPEDVALVGYATNRDGSALGFESFGQLTSEPVTSPDCHYDPNQTNRPEGVCTNVYVWDAATGQLDCASCVPSAGGHSTIGPRLDRGLEPRPAEVLADGRVLFNSPSRLVPGDVNGKLNDVYVWEGGGVSLISSGRGSNGSRLVGATPDGSSVFFATVQRLVAQDVDDSLDVYAARVGGGLPSQAVPPDPDGSTCDGDACQATQAPPSPRVPSTGTLAGAGNGALADRASFSLASVSRAQRVLLASGKRARLVVRVSRSGRLRLWGVARVGGREQVVLRVNRRANGAGRVVLRARLVKSARRQLARTGRLRVSLRLVFSPQGGKRTMQLDLRRTK